MTNDSPAVILYNESGLPVGIDNRPIIVNVTPNARSAFGEIRVAAPYTLLDLINKYEIDLDVYGTEIIGSATVTHIPNESAIRLGVTGSSGDMSRLLTNTFFRYQAGKGMYIKQSLYLDDAGNSNQIKRWGFYDGYNGLFWELNGTDFRVVRRTYVSGSAVDNVVSQSSWNIDTMDGYGDSGFNLDVTKGNIYEIQFAWLGVGMVRFLINGIVAHEMNNQNVIPGPYMTTAQLPLQWEILNSGASSSSNLTYICASVIAEGGSRPPGISFGALTPTDVTVTNTSRPLLSIRLKSTFNGITNRMAILPLLASISTDGGRATFRVIMNANLTGASWTSVADSSGVEFDVDATSFTDGRVLLAGLLADNISGTMVDLRELFSLAGRSMRQNAFATSVDSLTIVATKAIAGNTSMRANVNWEEVR